MPEDQAEKIKAAVAATAPDYVPVHITREEIIAAGGPPAGPAGPDPAVVARVLKAKLIALEL